MNLDPLLKYYFGETLLIELCVAGLLAEGHLLIEGPPGVGKTHLATLLSKAFNLDTQRVQGTPDLMPADVLGTHVLQNGEMVFRKGPVFCEILQVDEINRITPRTFSALLEAMQERAVSLRGERFPLPKCFHVLATRSTRELEGVYKIPEAALDRFVMSLRVSLPSNENEGRIALLPETGEGNCQIEGSLQEHQEAVQVLPYSQRILDRVVAISRLSREDESLLIGAGVRASQALLNTARALSYVRGEKSVTLDSLKDVALPVMSHRLKPYVYSYGVKAQVDSYLQKSDPAFALKERFAEQLQ